MDASTTAIGWSRFIDGRLIDYGLIKCKSKDWRERIKLESKELPKIIANADIIVAEDAPLKPGASTIQKLGGVQGMILTICADKKTEFILPSVWRSKLCLFDGTKDGMKRDAMKKKAIEMANKEFGLSLDSDDIAEAILIGKYYVVSA